MRGHMNALVLAAVLHQAGRDRQAFTDRLHADLLPNRKLVQRQQGVAVVPLRQTSWGLRHFGRFRYRDIAPVHLPYGFAFILVPKTYHPCRLHLRLWQHAPMPHLLQCPES